MSLSNKIVGLVGAAVLAAATATFGADRGGGGCHGDCGGGPSEPTDTTPTDTTDTTDTTPTDTTDTTPTDTTDTTPRETGGSDRQDPLTCGVRGFKGKDGNTYFRVVGSDMESGKGVKPTLIAAFPAKPTFPSGKAGSAKHDKPLDIPKSARRVMDAKRFTQENGINASYLECGMDKARDHVDSNRQLNGAELSVVQMDPTALLPVDPYARARFSNKNLGTISAKPIAQQSGPACLVKIHTQSKSNETIMIVSFNGAAEQGFRPLNGVDLSLFDGNQYSIEASSASACASAIAMNLNPE